MPQISVHFLGASGTVTGSKFYLKTPEVNIMVDCGLFQGLKSLRQLNWEPLPIPVDEVDYVLMTHGHLDHCGYLPRMVADGFKGLVYATPPTLAIAGIILRDTAKIQEEEAEQANKHEYSRHKPALPLYTLADAEKAVGRFRPKDNNQWIVLSDAVRCRFVPVGHIIGACFIEIEIFGKLFVFSGDIGRKEDLLLAPPEKPRWADYLFVESTYGNKRHPNEDVQAILADLVHKTIHERGCLLIPSFAVERLQSLMFVLWMLFRKNHIPNIPIFIDSPMGTNVLSVFERFAQWHKLPLKDYFAMCSHMTIIGSYRETWETIDDPRPKIVIAGSGMVTGGRILTYLQQLVDQTTTNILLVGYMAEGTRGRQLLEDAHEIKLFGKYYEVKAAVSHLESLSAHADQDGLLDWMSGLKNIPERVFLVHGEPTALDAFRTKISDTYGWKVEIPVLNKIVSIIC